MITKLQDLSLPYIIMTLAILVFLYTGPALAVFVGIQFGFWYGASICITWFTFIVLLVLGIGWAADK